MVERMRWMDMVRGGAILLVIHHHVLDSVVAKWPGEFYFFSLLTSFLAPFRMPVLMFLSGLLVTSSLSKGWIKYIDGKIRKVAYPFLVWTVIMYWLYELREVFLGETSGIVLWKALLYEPFHHLWFIYYLFCFYSLILIFSKVNPLKLLVCILLAYFLFGSFGYERFFSMFFFFVLGGCLGRDLQAAHSWVMARQRMLAVSSAILFLCFLAFSAYDMSKFYSYGLIYSCMALLAIVFVVVMSLEVEGGSFSRCLEYMGRNSIVFFLIHVPVAMVVPVFIVRIYDGDGLVVYPFLMVFVVSFSWGVSMLQEKSSFVRLFFVAPPLSYLKKVLAPS